MVLFLLLLLLLHCRSGTTSSRQCRWGWHGRDGSCRSDLCCCVWLLLWLSLVSVCLWLSIFSSLLVCQCCRFGPWLVPHRFLIATTTKGNVGSKLTSLAEGNAFHFSSFPVLLFPPNNNDNENSTHSQIHTRTRMHCLDRCKSTLPTFTKPSSATPIASSLSPPPIDSAIATLPTHSHTHSLESTW